MPSTSSAPGSSDVLELAQWFVPGRHSSLVDLLASACGAWAGILLVVLQGRYFEVSQGTSTRGGSFGGSINPLGSREALGT
jgi:hypothetical protein